MVCKRMIMKKVILIITSILLLASCDKPYQLDLPLSVAQRKISLTKDAGSTHILVYADGDWTASFTEPVSWASLNKVSGYGNNDLVFTYSANFGIARRVGIVLAKDELRDTVVLTQAGMISTPIYEPQVSQVPLFNTAGTAVVNATGNLLYCADAVYAYAIYPKADGTEEEVLIDGEDSDPNHWITSFEAEHNKFRFNVNANASGSERTAKLRLTIANPTGMVFNKYVNVSQNDIAPAFALPTLGYGSYGPDEQTVVVATSANTIWPYQDNMTIILGDKSWITDAYLVPDGLSLSLKENRTGSVRQQNITMTFVSPLGDVKTYKFTVIQSTK